MRKSDGEKCNPMTAYVIASAKSGLEKDLKATFPGCRVLPWNPAKKALRGNLKRAVEFVELAASQGADWLPFSAICEALDVDRTNFRKRVLATEEWQQEITALGFEATTGQGGAKGLRRVREAMAA